MEPEDYNILLIILIGMQRLRQDIAYSTKSAQSRDDMSVRFYYVKFHCHSHTYDVIIGLKLASEM